MVCRVVGGGIGQGHNGGHGVRFHPGGHLAHPSALGEPGEKTVRFTIRFLGGGGRWNGGRGGRESFVRDGWLLIGRVRAPTQARVHGCRE